MSHVRRKTEMARRDEKTSNALLIGIGVGLVTAVTGLSFAGTYSAIDAMTRQGDEAIAAAKEAVAKRNKSTQNSDGGGSSAVQQTPEQAASSVTTTQTESLSDQVRWMQENGISYNEYGLPVDKDGNVVDDPTIEVYDPSRSSYFFNDDGTPKDVNVESDDSSTQTSDTSDTQVDTSGNVTVVSPEVDIPDQTVDTKPATTATGWWLDAEGNLLDGLELDSDGKPCYVVKSGDWLIRIADKYGFTYQELAQASGISNPSLIYEGDVIHFPDKGASEMSNTQAPGRG